jgi:hypothetical protein
MLRRADTAMYQSKKNGRNRVTVWAPELETQVQSRRRIKPLVPMRSQSVDRPG